MSGKTEVGLMIFDLDGTLIESKWDIALSVNLTLGDLGLPLREQEEIFGFVGDGVAHKADHTSDPNVRLYPESQETLHPYTTWTEEPAWGTVVVIKEHMVLDHTQHWEIISMLEAKIPVEYRVLGNMHWASATFSEDPRVERVQYHVIGRAHRWRILGPRIPPHVGVTRVISFVRHAILQETDPKRRETLAALRDSLKEAR